MKSRKEIIVIDDLAPHPKYGAGCGRAADIYRALISRGYNVTLYLQRARALDREVYEAGGGFSRIRYMKNIDLPQLIKNIGPRLSHIWVSRTRNVTAFRGPLLAWKQEAPSRRRLISDTEALTSLRPVSLNVDIQAPESRDTCFTAARQELATSQGFDTVVCVSEFETEVAKTVLPEMSINWLESVFSRTSNTTLFNNRKHFFFCGAFHSSDSPNMDSVYWFSKRIWPKIKAALPDAEFHIGGFIGKEVAFPEPVGSRAKILGPIEDLQPYYNKYRVFVAPTRFAAGVPYKVRDAMSGGIPCVITELLAKQMPYAGNNHPFISSPIDTDEFARHCINLYSHQDVWHHTRQAAFQEIERVCAPKVFNTALGAILEDA